jgi:hypothetical protein
MWIWGRIKAIISNVKAVLAILGVLELSASISTILVSVGGGVWAVITGIPLPLVVMAAFCTFTGGIYLALAPMAYRALTRIQDAPPPVRRPDPEIWRHVSRLELFQAACLLADIEPDFTIVDKPGDANGWLTVLRDALRSDEIKYIKTVYDSQHVLADGYHPHKETVISRESLQQFAAKRHHRKAFLTD